MLPQKKNKKKTDSPEDPDVFLEVGLLATH